MRRALRLASILLVTTPLMAGAQEAARAPATPGDARNSNVEQYAACLVKSHSSKVVRVLDAKYDEFNAAAARLPTERCAVPNASPPMPGQYRGALFAAYYRKYGPQAGRSASNILQTWTPPSDSTEERARWLVISACLVNKAPSESRDFVRAVTESAQEAAALKAIVPKLGGCLPDQTFKLSRWVLKGLIAETVYRIDFATERGG